jgi:hypothetical protein
MQELQWVSHWEQLLMAKRKPHDPAAALRAASDRAQHKAEALRIKAQGGDVRLDAGGRIISAWRSNVFRLLLERGTITPNHHDAAYTLAKDWAAWKGLDGKPETFGQFVDGGSGSAELITDRMLNGGRRVRRALEAIDPLSRVILEAFMVATVEEDRAMAWRGIMERLKITGRERQTALVVAALEALRVQGEEPGRRAA